MTTDTEDDYRMNRRTFLKGIGATAGAAAVGGVSSHHARAADSDDEGLTGGEIARLYSTPATSLYGGHLIGKLDPSQYSITVDTSDEIHWSSYGAATTQQDRYERLITEAESQIDQSITLAYSDIKISAVESLNNNEDVGSAVSDAQRAVNELYSQLQKSTIYKQANAIQNIKALESERLADDTVQLHENAVYGFNTTYDETLDTTDLSASLTHQDFYSSSTVDPVFQSSDYTVDRRIAFFEQTFKTFAGEEITVENAVAYVQTDPTIGSGGAALLHFADYGDGLLDGDDANYAGLTVKHPDDSSESERRVLTAPRAVRYVLDRLDDVRSQALDDAQQIVESIYEAYDAGEIENPEDVLNGTDRTRMLTEDYVESGAEAAPLAIAYEVGYETSASASMHIDYEDIIFANAIGDLAAGTESDDLWYEYNSVDVDTLALHLDLSSTTADELIIRHYDNNLNLIWEDSLIPEEGLNTYEFAVEDLYTSPDDVEYHRFRIEPVGGDISVAEARESYPTESLQGALYSTDTQAVFGDQIEVGETVDTRDIDPTLTFLEIDGSGTVNEVTLDGIAEVTKILDNDGNEVDRTGTHDNEFSTTDTSRLNEQIDQLIEDREKQDETVESSIVDDILGGGSGSTGLDVPSWAWVVPGLGIIWYLYEEVGD